MREISAEIVVQAAADRVWQVLTDMPAYAEWNPFIRNMRGDLRVGGKLEVFIQPVGGRGMRFRPTVLVYEPGRELRWLGRLFLPRLFDGEHRFQITPLPEGGVRFTQSESFRGILVSSLSGMLGGTLEGFKRMNQALKTRAEERDAGTG